MSLLHDSRWQQTHCSVSLPGVGGPFDMATSVRTGAGGQSLCLPSVDQGSLVALDLMPTLLRLSFFTYKIDCSLPTFWGGGYFIFSCVYLSLSMCLCLCVRER